MSEMSPLERLRAELGGYQYESEYENEENEGERLTKNICVPEDINIISLSVGEVPDGEWLLEPLYRKEKGKTRVWFVQYKDMEKELWITHGYMGDNCKLQENKVDIVLNTSGRTYKEQAYQEAKSRFLVKCRRDNYHTGSNAESCGPMLAYKYKENIIKRWPVFVDMKINGWRGIVKYVADDSDKIRVQTRGGIRYKWLEEQRGELEIFLNYLPADSQLDCELWNPGYSRNKIQSILSTTDKKHELNDTIEFYIFDIIENNGLTLTERWELLLNSYREYAKDMEISGKEIKYIRLLNKYTVNSHEEIMRYHELFVKEYGAEGLMVKKICSKSILNKRDNNMELSKSEMVELEESRYRPRRCNSMYKVKQFEDDEGIIIGFDVARGTQEGCITLILRMESGKEFRVGSFQGITLEERQSLAKEGDNLIGRKFTFKYQELSSEGIPQHPVGVGLRDFM